MRERAGSRSTIQVLPSGVVRVTAPPGTHIPSLLDRHAAWIERKRGEYLAIARDRAGQEGRVLLGGRFYRLETGPACAVREEEGVVTYTTPKELKAFLKERLTATLLPRLEREAERMRVPFGGLTLREQRSRWASCSPSGGISVNLRVLALPGAILDYLVVHELAHLLEPNHSRRYWKRVGEFYPDYRFAEEELKRYWVLLEQDSIWKVLRKLPRD
ncbi:MAG: M48 family metallopeptidase [Methanomicrobiales archaeon]|nr:M48 family metallopeptidase [Methanomicrobiales archaeon]